MVRIDKKVYLTQEGLANFQAELKRLNEVERPRVVKRMSRAREKGDLSENSDYHDARDRLRFIQDRILQLKGILAKASVIKRKKNPDEVALGCQVTVQKDGQKEVFIIVGEHEADPTKKKISSRSPLGEAFIGRKVGDQVEVETPGGQAVYTIKKIE